MSVRPAIKAKSNLHIANWIIGNFPEDHQNLTYLEPYCGNANVLFNKEKSQIEVINDLDLGIIQIYRALRDEPKEFIRRLKLCKYSQETFDKCFKKEESKDYLEHAVNEYILRRMSRSGLKKSFAWSEKIRGGQPGEINAWESALKELPNLGDRLKEVFLFNKKAIEIIQIFDLKSSLLYIDPPFLYETKVSKTVYSSEMSTEEHIELSRILNNFKGKVILSGIPSPLYNRLYKNWNQKKKKASKGKKAEILWLNY